MNLNLKLKSECKYDAVSRGEVILICVQIFTHFPKKDV